MKKNNIQAIDFGLLYELQKEASTYKRKSVQDWDEKAPNINQRIHQGSYNEILIDYINLENVSTLLDLGCGPGTFSLRFAPLLEQIYALDFSSKMLELLEKNAKEKSISNIKTFCLDLEEEWNEVPKADIVLASRCLEVANLKQTLIKINSFAKKAVYLTFKDVGSFLSDEVLEVIGLEITPKPDYIYVVNILYSLGIKARVDFINPKDLCCQNKQDEEDYVKSIKWSLDGLNELQEKKLKKYYQECKATNKAPAFRNNAWALISWEK